MTAVQLINGAFWSLVFIIAVAVIVRTLADEWADASINKFHPATPIADAAPDRLPTMAPPSAASSGADLRQPGEVA